MKWYDTGFSLNKGDGTNKQYYCLDSTIIRGEGGIIVKSSKVLSANLKRYRDKYELSQEELADRSGLSTRGYGEIERGHVQTSLGVLNKLAVATGLIPAELLDENLDLNTKN